MKPTTAADAAWSAVATADPSVLDREGTAELFQSIAEVRATCDAAEVLAVRRTRELCAAGTSEPAENMLANQTGRSSKDARAAATREEACAAMPALEAGLAAGSTSAGHVDAAAGVHSKLNEEVAKEFAAHDTALAARSQQLGVDAFERECRDLARHLTAVNDPNAEVDELERQKAASSVKRWVDKVTGMHNTLISLDPIRDAKMWKVITNQVGRERQQRKTDGDPPLPFTALQAQAVVTAVTRTPATAPADTPTAGDADSPRTATTSTAPASNTSASTAPASARTANATTTQATTTEATNAASTETPAQGTAATNSSTSNGPTSAAATTSDSTKNRLRAADAAPAGTMTTAPVAKGTRATNGAAAPTGSSAANPTSAAAVRLPEIAIHCDIDTLISGIRAAGGLCETDDGIPIPPQTVRRLACDAKIIPVLLGSRGEVLDQGRQVRTATPAQRAALAAMHRGCAFPGCTVGFSDSRIHHIRWWWEHRGRSDIDNLLPLCEKHHHLVHEGAWGLTLDPGRIATWTRPDGRIHLRGPTIDRRPPVLPLRP